MVSVCDMIMFSTSVNLFNHKLHKSRILLFVLHMNEQLVLKYAPERVCKMVLCKGTKLHQMYMGISLITFFYSRMEALY